MVDYKLALLLFFLVDVANGMSTLHVLTFTKSIRKVYCRFPTICLFSVGFTPLINSILSFTGFATVNAGVYENTYIFISNSHPLELWPTR